jgi:hypothetical protein
MGAHFQAGSHHTHPPTCTGICTSTGSRATSCLNSFCALQRLMRLSDGWNMHALIDNQSMVMG